MSLDEPNDTAAGIPLEAHVAELRSRRKAVARLYDGSTYFREECEIFKQYAREKECCLAHSPETIKRTPDDEGNEHQVWFRHTPGEFNPYGRRASRADRFTHTALGWCPIGAGPEPLPTDRVIDYD